MYAHRKNNCSSFCLKDSKLYILLFRAPSPLWNTLHPHLNIKRTIRRPHIANTYQQHINESPNAKSTKAEEFSQTFPPLAQIETIGTESTKGDAIGIKTWFIIIIREAQFEYLYTLLSDTPTSWWSIQDTIHILYKKSSFKWESFWWNSTIS